MKIFRILLWSSLITTFLAACNNEAPPAAPGPDDSQHAEKVTSQSMENQPEETTQLSNSSDYSQADAWLCRPGREDACAINLDTTVVAASGSLTLEPHTVAEDPGFDCFYVYPTVSNDPGGNSDMNVGPEELSVIKAQFARFNSVCRTYAPLYRQITLTALRSRIAGESIEFDVTLGYQDVVDAWRYYLENDNHNRGVVLVGHSQGSGVLARLIANEIESQPIQANIISALLTGSRVAVPEGAVVGGQFKEMALCEGTAQTGCIITFASFREAVPPPADSRFGRVEGEGMVAACTNPAALGGGSGELRAYMSAGRSGVSTSSNAPLPWVTNGQPITTPFVSLPGMLSAECSANEFGNYLSVRVHGDPADPRTDDIVGDVVINGEVQANWGLHLIDVNLAMGNLLAVVETQFAAWSTSR